MLHRVCNWIDADPLRAAVVLLGGVVCLLFIAVALSVAR
jgi:hypothetical protein